MSNNETSTCRVLVHRTMSLDGYIAGPDHAMGWIFDHVEADDFPEVITATGAILAGRRTYEVGRRDAGEVHSEAYGGAWSGPQFVLTHEPPPPVEGDTSVIFLTDDIDTAVETARQAAGGKNLEIFGADVAAQCLQRGLVDEILVHIVPVLLGEGTQFYQCPNGAAVGLEPVSTTQAGAITTIRYRVTR